MKPEPAPGSSVGDPVARESSVDREPGRVTMATDEAQDDLPVGTEGIQMLCILRDNIRGIKHDFPYISICKVSWEIMKTER